jgi:hypothetical protein
MATKTSHVFSPEYLAEAGVLTVDLIERNVKQGQLAEATSLVNRFQEEILTMFYSYIGWERDILNELADIGGTATRDQALSRIQNKEIAPERLVQVDGLAEQWQAKIKDIKSLLETGESSNACRLARELYTHALGVHDGMMSRVSALLSILYENYGEDVLAKVLDKVMRPETMDPGGKLPFREKVEKIIHFTRVHLLPSKIVEDDEKVTFMPDPCPSGARLVRGGHYEAPRNGVYVKGPGPLTYGRKDLPVYCCHEPAMEISSIRKNGVPIFIVDPPEDIGVTPCKVYIYKNPRDIPAAYYQRLGVSKPDEFSTISD